MFTFLGLIYNVINPPLPGDKTSNKNIPFLIDEMMAKGGSAFGMNALFLGGMAVVGKAKLLQGKKLVLPIILSLIKVLVAPIVGFYIATAIFQGDKNAKLYAQYVFIYSSFPTAGSIIVFAQSYDVALQDMISGAAVLSLILWSPIMFTAATLLVGGSISGAGVSDASHVLSILGGSIIMMTAMISTGWRRFPKCDVALLSFVTLLFSISHIGCYNSIQHAKSGWNMTSSSEWYNLTFFFRIWSRMLFAFTLPTNLLLLWTKGTKMAQKIFPFTVVGSLIIAIAITVGFAAGSSAVKSIYPCWYRYGPEQ